MSTRTFTSGVKPALIRRRRDAWAVAFIAGGIQFKAKPCGLTTDLAARYGGNLSVLVDSRNEPELAQEILKQAAMACPAILEEPATSVAAMEFKDDRVTYSIYFSTSSFASAEEARSQIITQLWKRCARAITCLMQVLSFFRRGRVVRSSLRSRTFERGGENPVELKSYQTSF